SPGRMTLDASVSSSHTAPYELVRQMRASYYVLGPLVARKGLAEVSLPGGCAIGQRAIDLHLKGISMLGAEIAISRGYIYARSSGRLTGRDINLTGTCGSSVGATMNMMMASSLARGKTVLHGVAREPEVVDLARMLNLMGARIEGAGNGGTITIEGVVSLRGADYKVIPDRIEAGTLAVAAAITGGDLLISGCRPEHLEAPLEVLERSGVMIESSDDGLRVSSQLPLKPFSLETEPYPGFPTDMQAQFCALATQARGTSQVTETIFENRFMHVSELVRMGARMQASGNTVTITGPSKLSCAPVMASDLRASAALVLAALVAEGTSEINRIYHLDRGYEALEIKLSRLGAKILRVSG
ncbi:MAG: UDP-N-acetylglucosamine 1-carboxyvinyltransferase, partial [Gemmatimonadota bacterium]|nr:UDP-N-acetylglucosamine 1-carboxyvinyltransferase [Gemmatimonadota bacterium]